MVYRPREALRFFLTNQAGEIVVRAEPLQSLTALLEQTKTLLRGSGKRPAVEMLRRCQQLVAEHVPPTLVPVPALQIVAG
jgi:hypothetical protein